MQHSTFRSISLSKPCSVDWETGTATYKNGPQDASQDQG